MLECQDDDVHRHLLCRLQRHELRGMREVPHDFDRWFVPRDPRLDAGMHDVLIVDDHDRDTEFAVFAHVMPLPRVRHPRAALQALSIRRQPAVTANIEYLPTTSPVS